MPNDFYAISASNAATGSTPYYDETASNTVTNIQTNSGNLYGVIGHNPNTSTVFLQLFDSLAANVTLGTTTPTQSWPIPGGASSTGGGFVMILPVPIQFDTAISYAFTTTAGGLTAPSSNVVFNAIKR